MIRPLLCCALLLMAADARAQEPDDTATPVSAEFVDLFSSYCLKQFPDDRALSDRAAGEGQRPLTSAEVGSFLHVDPGMGWTIAGRETSYVLTVQVPPYHACALRRYSEVPLDGAPFIEAARGFAALSGHKLAPPLMRQRDIGNGIVSSGIYFQELDEKDKPLSEAFMFFTVRYPAVARADGAPSKPFWEVRFVRQIHVPRSI
ncbi:MAG: hypothetical protein BGN85_05025 [Alphaproteobacteria bacterium 64-11]|nr:hypothetical protein [Alphaproteobacteria bacterium]OJU08546.1 MAG: hypothetical protein BGN85_05025 [Alphaproteobacteria bacterium 64-11]